MSDETKIQLYRGDTLNYFSINYKQVDGSVFDLTGYSAVMSVRDSNKNLILSINQTPNSNQSVVTINTTTGTITPFITHADTNLIKSGTYLYDVRIVRTMSQENYLTIISGKLEVLESQQ